jgi:hypothetical protein
LAARFPVGLHPTDADFNQLGEVGGAKSHSHTHVLNNGSNVQTPTETFPAAWSDSSDSAIARIYTGSTSVSRPSVVKTMNNQSVPTLPPYITFVFIICALP